MSQVVSDEALLDVQWTVSCPTDDDELLRFAEAIPAAIYGSKGFHSANDRLFLPLLDTPNPQRCSRSLLVLLTF